jgi:hypothetical protein
MEVGRLQKEFLEAPPFSRSPRPRFGNRDNLTLCEQLVYLSPLSGAVTKQHFPQTAQLTSTSFRSGAGPPEESAPLEIVPTKRANRPLREALSGPKLLL